MLKRSPPRWVGLLVLLLSPGPLPAVSAPAPPGPTEAAAAERSGDWERACGLRFQAWLADRGRTEERDRFHYCLRRLRQARRLADPAYRDRLQRLPLARALDLYTEVLEKLRGHHADRERADLGRLFAGGVEELGHALADDRFRRDHLPGVGESAALAFRSKLDAGWRRELRDVPDARRAARDLAAAAQRELGVRPAAVVLEIACGACAALDEYTAYLSPGAVLDEDSAAAEQELAVLGVTVTVRDGRAVVGRVAAGSWAAVSGLTEGDRVVRVGPRLLGRVTPESWREAVRADAEPGAELEVTADDRPARVVRLPLVTPSVVQTRMLDAEVGYVRLVGFDRTTAGELDGAVLSLRMRGMRALVLDLRGNPGGLFQAAVQVAERFLADGVVVSVSGSAGQRVYSAAGGTTVTDVPLVVLVDGETASAAEVVAGALKDHARAVLVGQTTFGKGTVQVVIPLKVAGPQSGAVRVTLARFVSPAGSAYEGAGVTPHVPEPDRDRQLDAAVSQAARLTGR